MQNLTIAQTLTMSSLEIANLVGSRHDNVKIAIERLAAKSIIRLPAMQDSENINNLGLLRIPAQSERIFWFEREREFRCRERIFWRVNTRPNELNVTSPYASATGLFGAHCAALRLSPATEPLPKETGART
ncbi:hypothetical protein [Sodalis glossinidius]|uniref:hypothetical protein n=1 Tax=Sodalis glossinidius TaxID=63612 RepID=UPI001411BD10